ncbi:MAG: 7-carboxy-7-deazaguanine synthase QueE [Prevotellaceae bacterium]|jgi:organic radical activating enzyme|nr:7-carboxy-7-deazaguanine synthase QueE [Prevotellaceae bacterium]
MKKMRINEIFYSLQGEGFWTGTPIVFVRFAGCNLRCDFCDTQHETFTEMTESEILSQIKSFPTKRVCLTGGEPSLQITENFIELLHREGYIIHIETNGTNPLPAGIDWVTLSPKTDNIALQKADELKLVYINNVEPEKWLSFPAAHFFLQPCSNRNTGEVIDYVLAQPAWRLSLQVHKVLGIR